MSLFQTTDDGQRMVVPIADLLRMQPRPTESGAPADLWVVKGWIRTSRFSKRTTFLMVYDGSSKEDLQIVIPTAVASELKARLTVGAAVRVLGVLVLSKGAEQPVELLCAEENVQILGDCDPRFPVQKKAATPEFYRTIPHLRTRTAEYQRIFRARAEVSQAIHRFLSDAGFLWMHTPIITASDCEGAGEAFHVATKGDGLDPERLHDEAFFGQPAYLTVSGQLEAEAAALSFGRVYTFGPTFRAENSNTARHAAEFWMVEPEVAFADKEDAMRLAEQLVQFCMMSVLGVKGYERTPAFFARVSYTKAIELLMAQDKVRAFANPIQWGMNLQTEHERFLADEVFKGPVFVTDYPAQIKPFYMRLNEDLKTVACFDLLVPGVGELVGGSQREERLGELLLQMAAKGIDPFDYEQYVDLRRFGSVPHAGFGLGLERLLMWLLDVPNIRDVQLYPRTPGQI